MIPLTVTTDIDKRPWTDIAAECKQMGNITRIGRLPGGMESGKSSVSVLVEMPDGTKHIAETSMALFQTAAEAFRFVDDKAEADRVAKSN